MAEYKFKPKPKGNIKPAVAFKTKSGETKEVSNDTFRDYAAAAIRGVTAFAPGGLIGAGAGLLGEGLAQTIESRENYNPAQMIAQAGLGAIPFGRVASVGRSAIKGGMLGGAGSVITQQAEEGLHVPRAEEIPTVALSTAIGAAGGAASSRLAGKIGQVEYKFKPKPEANPTPKQKAQTEVSKAVAQVKEEPVIKRRERRIKEDMRRKPDRPMIMSKSGPEEGYKILEEAMKGPKNIPKVDLQATSTPIVKEPSARAPYKESTLSGLINLPKAFSASGDLSAPLRQGIFLMGRKSWVDSWKPMLKALKTSNFDEEVQRIVTHPRYEQAQKDGIVFTEAGNTKVGEEAFASKIASRIPIFGKYVIKPSERAYTTFLNNLRLRTYDDLMSKAEKLAEKTPGFMIPNKNIADYINTASGRGNIGFTVGSKSEIGEKAAGLLNNVFFSPRFIASRVQLLNPYSYYKLDPFTRMEALRDLATLTGAASSVLGLAHMAGADVTIDPRETDFGKIRIGNARIDPLGGFGQYIRLFAQTVNGMATDEPGPDPARFIESKLSPTARLIGDITRGKDYFRKDVTIPTAVAKTFAPILAQDIYQLWQEDPELVPLAGLSFVGIPTMSYGETNRRRTGSSNLGMPKVQLPQLPQLPTP